MPRVHVSSWTPIRHAVARRMVITLAAAGLVSSLGPGRVLAQEPGRSYPSLPGSGRKLPDGIESGAPFDVARFLAMPPPSRNAAPLYLDALSEFGAATSACFPAGAEQRRRREAADNRMRRYQQLTSAIEKAPGSVSPASIDEVIGLYGAGFRKLAAAQRRESCVFDGGFGMASLLPHVQDARQVARIASLRVRRDIEKDDINAALRDVETVLRLARDLKPRGFLISQVTSAAIVHIVGDQMITPILAAPSVRASHCEHLLRILADHESKSANSYVEGLRAEYLVSRVNLHDLIRDQKGVARWLGEMGIKSAGPVVQAFIALVQAPEAARSLPADADAIVARTTAEELSRSVNELNAGFRAALALDGIPFAARLRQIAAVKPRGGDDPLGRVVKALQPNVASLTTLSQAIARETAIVRGWECWSALRHSQLNSRGRTPRELSAAIKAAGLKNVPIDPYDGKPMRMTVVAGRPVVYSIGKDGRDDGGEKDSKMDSQPSGDLIYRLEPAEAPR